MKEIKVGRDAIAIIDDDDYETLSQKKWQKSGSGYAKRQELSIVDGKIKYKTIWMHRLIMKTPDDLVVDHIDGNKLNNQKKNLRNCTRAQNHLNRKMPKNSIWKYKGVEYQKYWPDDRKWVCFINVDGIFIKLGRFLTETEAAAAYNEASKKYHGEYGYQNKIPHQ